MPDPVEYPVEPTRKVRDGVRQRDGERCVACGKAWGLTYQHRIARSQGGRGSYANGLAACAACNARFEADLQSDALRFGWKVRGWVKDPARVPYLNAVTMCWYAVAADGPWRRRIDRHEAAEMMLAVYGEAMR